MRMFYLLEAAEAVPGRFLQTLDRGGVESDTGRALIMPDDSFSDRIKVMR